MKPKQHTPTEASYSEWKFAYDFFNNQLFNGKLLRCIITLQRRGRTYGYFSPKRFKYCKKKQTADEIAGIEENYKLGAEF